MPRKQNMVVDFVSSAISATIFSLTPQFNLIGRHIQPTVVDPFFNMIGSLQNHTKDILNHQRNTKKNSVIYSKTDYHFEVKGIILVISRNDYHIIQKWKTIRKHWPTYVEHNNSNKLQKLQYHLTLAHVFICELDCKTKIVIEWKDYLDRMGRNSYNDYWAWYNRNRTKALTCTYTKNSAYSRNPNSKVTSL